MTTKVRPLASYRYSALVIGGLLLLGGLLCYVFAAQSDSMVRQSILSNIGSAMTTIGAIGLVYDSLLKPRLLADIAGATDLSVAGVDRISLASLLLISEAPPRSSTVAIYTPDVSDWLKQSDWRFLCDYGSRTRITLNLTIGPMDATVMSSVRKRLEEDWAGHEGNSPAGKGSILNVFGSQCESQVGLYRSGDVAIVTFDVPFGDYRPGRALGLLVHSTGSFMWTWIDRIERQFSGSAKLFAVQRNRQRDWH